MEYVLEYLLLGDPEVGITVVRMGAVMDDAVHVQVHVVEVWNLKNKNSV